MTIWDDVWEDTRHAAAIAEDLFSHRELRSACPPSVFHGLLGRGSPNALQPQGIGPASLAIWPSSYFVGHVTAEAWNNCGPGARKPQALPLWCSETWKQHSLSILVSWENEIWVRSWAYHTDCCYREIWPWASAGGLSFLICAVTLGCPSCTGVLWYSRHSAIICLVQCRPQND